MGNRCTWAREDESGGSRRDSQSTPAADEPQQEPKGKRVRAAADLANFRVCDHITVGDPPWIAL